MTKYRMTISDDAAREWVAARLRDNVSRMLFARVRPLSRVAELADEIDAAGNSLLLTVEDLAILNAVTCRTETITDDALAEMRGQIERLFERALDDKRALSEKITIMPEVRA